MNKLYENIGSKIKNWAMGSFIVEAIAALIGGIIFIAESGLGEEWIGILIIIGGINLAYFISLLVYGAGERVEKLCNIDNKIDKVTIVAQSILQEQYKKKEDIKPKSSNYIKSETEETKKNESDEKAKREAYEQAKHIIEKRKEELAEDGSDNSGALLKCEKTLSDQILDALTYQNDATMIGYLRSLKDERIDELLKQPSDTIRDTLVNLLQEL